jgi:hypothetical protein
MYDTVSNVLYKEAYGFLVNRVGENILKEHLNYSSIPVAGTMSDVYQHLTGALVSTKNMKEAIGDINQLAEYLSQFDPIMAYADYGDNWERLINNINPNIKPTNSLKPKQIKACWKLFCKGALSGASFLSQLGFLEDFKAFVNGFYYNEMSQAVLPLLLQKEIEELGYQPACAFLNNVGYPDYICPDQKVKALLYDIGVTETRDNYEVLKAIVMMAKHNEKQTVIIHKIFLLIASNTFKDSFRQEFIEHITPILNSLPQ